MKGRREHTDENKGANRMANLDFTTMSFNERRKASKKARKLDLLACVIYAIIVLFGIDLVISWIEVITHNISDPDYVYSWFNIFRIITGR